MEYIKETPCPYCGKPGHGREYHVPTGAGTSKPKPTPTPAWGKPKASEIGGECPRCGGTQFEVKRSRGQKLMTGYVGSLLLTAKEVRCVMCGMRFKRK